MRIKLNIQRFADGGQCLTATTPNDKSLFYVNWQQASQDVTNNKTTINYQYGVYCGVNYYSNAVGIDYVNINGVKVKNSQTYSYLNSGWHELGSGSMDIYHNADGTKTFNINLSGWAYGEGTVTGSTNFQLNPIPRHFTQKPKVQTQSTTTTGGTFKWTTSENCSAVKYILDGGAETSCFSGTATTGTFNISGLLSNTSHTLKINAQRKDSGLWDYSDQISFSTSNKTVKVKVNGEWKNATPYIRVNGQWKVATPFTRENGQWKRGK